MYIISMAKCSSEVAAWQSNNEDFSISLNDTEYCFVNECTIRIKESNVLLNIINKTTNWIVAISNATNLFTVPATASDSYCSLEDPKVTFFIVFVVVTFIIVSSSSLNIVLHLAIKELRTVPGMIIVGICGTAIIVFLCVTSTAVFQYLYRVNGNPAICAMFKYIITCFVIIYAILKVTYLFHFAYMMYRTYTAQRPFEESKTLLYFYGVVTAIAGTICTVLVIVIDLLHERTVFAMHNGYCADFFHDPGVDAKVGIALLVVMTVIFFIIAITLYYLTTKRFCTCGSTTGPSNFRVSITLILAIALGGILLHHHP